MRHIYFKKITFEFYISIDFLQTTRVSYFFNGHSLLQAVKRLQKRNALTEEEAKQRIASQPSNAEQIEHANIVFSPFWSYEYTQAQIDRAWDSLEELLRHRK